MSLLNPMDIDVKAVRKIDPVLLPQLNELISLCDNYEPYYCDKYNPDFIQIAAFDKNRNSSMVGFLGLLRQSGYYELSACVLPSYRKKGIFRKMLQKAFDSKTSVINKDTLILCPVLSEYCNSSLVSDIAFTEYLMKLNSDNYKNAYKSPASSINPAGFNDFEFEYDEEECAYYMYRKDEDSPLSLLNLDFQKTFSNIYGVYVDEEVRGIGIGYILMSHFLSDYFNGEITDNITPLILNVTDKNPAAMALYKKCGFTEASHIDYHKIIC